MSIIERQCLVDKVKLRLWDTVESEEVSSRGEKEKEIRKEEK